MSLAMILRPPSSPHGESEWFFAHAQDHQAIVDLIRLRLSVFLPTYVIDPVEPGDLKGFALRHQAYHNELNGVLGLDGTDLQGVEWQSRDERENWYFLNWQEHVAAHKRLAQ